MALAVTVIAARLSAVGGDSAPAIDRLGAHQVGFLVCGLLVAPAAIRSWLLRDNDVAATRGLEPVPVRSADARAIT